jgi:hypothetical protein
MPNSGEQVPPAAAQILDRDHVTRMILAERVRRGLRWADVAAKVGQSKVYPPFFNNPIKKQSKKDHFLEVYRKLNKWKIINVVNLILPIFQKPGKSKKWHLCTLCVRWKFTRSMKVYASQLAFMRPMRYLCVNTKS